MNQCDGCQIRAPFNKWGHHVYPGGSLSGCTKHLYETDDSGKVLISEKLQREKNDEQ